MESHFKLTELRKRFGYTQQELGLLIAKEEATEITAPYAQKKVSQWESGVTRPNRTEVDALARIFGEQPEAIELLFAKSTPLSAADMLNDLADSSKPSLVIACYSGKPRATLMADVRNAIITGLKRKMSFAMFYPHPAGLSKKVSPVASEELIGFYRDTWEKVKTNYETFRTGLPPQQRQHVRLYCPPRPPEGANILVPPSSNRYTLVTEMVGESEFRSTLYSWVETEVVDGLFRVGTFSMRSAVPQILVWQAYFGHVLTYWKRNYTLPPSGEYWTSYTSRT